MLYKHRWWVRVWGFVHSILSAFPIPRDLSPVKPSNMRQKMYPGIFSTRETANIPLVQLRYMKCHQWQDSTSCEESVLLMERDTANIWITLNTRQLNHLALKLEESPLQQIYLTVNHDENFATYIFYIEPWQHFATNMIHFELL